MCFERKDQPTQEDSCATWMATCCQYRGESCRLTAAWLRRREKSGGTTAPWRTGRGKPRDIVSPCVVEVVIQEHRWKQAKFERRARSEPFDDLPGRLIFFVRVGPGEVEVELIGVHFGQEIAAAGECFQIEELVFFQAMNGFDVALIGVSGR